MSDEQEPLDQALAQKLRAAAEHEPAPLDVNAQARVLSAMLAESARLARRQRLRTRVTLGALALAAAAVLGLMLREPVAVPVAATSAPVCELSRVAAQESFRSEQGRQLLSLGRFGRIAAEAGAHVRVLAEADCELVVELAHGTLAAELSDLRPGKLRVRTALGDVLVRGTTFSVHIDDTLDVALLKGAVDVVVHDDGDAITSLTPGRALKRGQARTPQLHELSSAERETISGLIDPRPAVPEPAVVAPATDEVAHDAGLSSAGRGVKRSATELLAAAEQARRDGREAEARALYRQAGSHSDADAEVALLRWARLELSAQQPGAALDVLKRHRRRFARGQLGAEAGSLQLLALERLGRLEEAGSVARALIARFPDSEHAKAAQRFVVP